MNPNVPYYKSFGPDAEVLGQAMLAFVESINYPDFQQILAAHELNHIDPEKWYPQQVWLDVFNDIADEGNMSSDFISIGMKVIETAVMPEGYSNLSFVEQLRGFGGAYAQNNRGNDIGFITAEVVSDQHVIMHDATPYPDDFVYGAYYALTRRLLPPDTVFNVYFDNVVPRRDTGGTQTLVHIEWE